MLYAELRESVDFFGISYGDCGCGLSAHAGSSAYPGLASKKKEETIIIYLGVITSEDDEG